MFAMRVVVVCASRAKRADARSESRPHLHVQSLDGIGSATYTRCATKVRPRCNQGANKVRPRCDQGATNLRTRRDLGPTPPIVQPSVSGTRQAHLTCALVCAHAGDARMTCTHCLRCSRPRRADALIILSIASHCIALNRIASIVSCASHAREAWW